MKKVLLITNPTAFINSGGGEREILLLNDILNKKNIISNIYGPSSYPLESYDVLIHLSMIGGAESIIIQSHNKGIKLILWPNLWFAEKPSIEQVSQYNRFIEYFDAIVFKTRTEERHFKQFLKLEKKEIIRVSNIISPCFYRNDIKDSFRESFGIENYAIWTGIIEPQKNQLAAIRAFKYIDQRIKLIISGSVRDTEYFEQCRKEAGPNVIFMPAFPFGSEIHLSAIKYARCYLELSQDFPGVSALEAQVLGVKLILNKCDWVSEVVGKNCVQVGSNNIDEIKNAVINILREQNKPTYGYKKAPDEECVRELVEYINTIK